MDEQEFAEGEGEVGRHLGQGINKGTDVGRGHLGV